MSLPHSPFPISPLSLSLLPLSSTLSLTTFSHPPIKSLYPPISSIPTPCPYSLTLFTLSLYSTAFSIPFSSLPSCVYPRSTLFHSLYFCLSPFFPSSSRSPSIRLSLLFVPLILHRSYLLFVVSYGLVFMQGISLPLVPSVLHFSFPSASSSLSLLYYSSCVSL